MPTIKGFIKNWRDEIILPITRGELVLDSDGQMALQSIKFLATDQHPGLMSPEEKAMLSGSGSGQSLKDLYTKIEYINNGIQVGGGTLKFYNSEGQHTPINFVSPEEGHLNITVAPNTQDINIALAEIVTETSIQKRLNTITVDKYGRVTSVDGAPLLDSEIPPELTGKTLTNATLSNAKTDIKEIGTDDLSIVNKAYVDAQVNEISKATTGALIFGGTISDVDAAIQVLEDNTKDWDKHYFKVTGNFTLEAKYLNSKTEGEDDQPVKKGDTLIVHESKYVYVPSADEVVTRLTVFNTNAVEKALEEVDGNITLQFSSVFDVKSPPNTSKTATITLPVAGAQTDGYLSATDWNRFNEYNTKLAVTYTGTVTQSMKGSYEIGKIKIGTSAEQVIYGINNIANLTLENGSTSGSNPEYNPILKFTETNLTNPYEIVLQGSNGITVKKNDKTVEFRVAIDPLQDKYLKINQNGQLQIVIGSENNDTAPLGNTSESINDGLTDYREFIEFQNNVVAAFERLFINIDNTLEDETKTYHYGSTALINALNFESSEK